MMRLWLLVFPTVLVMDCGLVAIPCHEDLAVVNYRARR